MDRTLTYTVSIEESDLRADQFLSRRGFSSHLLTRLRKNMEHLLINGTPSRTNTPLHEGDILTVHIVEEHSSYHVPPVELPLSIVYEDEDILVANKPAKMPIHPSMDNYYNSLANALAWYYRDSGNFIFRCTNRLDRDTSGLTVIAKNPPLPFFLIWLFVTQLRVNIWRLCAVSSLRRPAQSLHRSQESLAL